MELVTGALGSLIPKLKDLLKEEYKLQTGVKDQVRFLERELESAHTTLLKVAEVRPDQLDEVVKIWARDVREASYHMEDILDTYLVRVEGSHQPNDKESLRKRLAAKMNVLFKKSKAGHNIAGAIENMRRILQEVTERHDRFSVDSIVAKPAASSRTVDPRISAMFRGASQIIGIANSRDHLISMLCTGDDESNQKMKIVSIVGAGGLGKTTLAKAVYDDDHIKEYFDCRAFVPVGQNPDLKKVFRGILIDLDKDKYIHLKYEDLDGPMLIDEFLGTKRCFVVIDDIWDLQSWDIKKLARAKNNFGSRIIITTRNFEVAREADDVYKIEPLSDDNSKKLFYTRLFGSEDKCPTNDLDELVDRVLKKCRGVPLAIITMASLLVGKSRTDWIEVCNSPGFYQDKDDKHMADTMRILAFSYYDLPSHLKTCLLYLSVFPEDSLIHKSSLIWKWIAEGFVEKKPGRELFEVGEEYFDDLINRSLIQQVEIKGTDLVYGCQVHDLVLDLVRSLSREENFVFVLNEGGKIFQSSKFGRRLAIHNRKEQHRHGDNMNLFPRLRSLTAIQCPMYMIPPVFSFKLLRVLDLESCRLMEGYDLRYLGNISLLRFISLRNTFVRTLPEDLGNLKMLQTLELEGSGVEELPERMGQISGLMCLNADWTTRVPDWIEKVTCLQHLVMYCGCCGDDEVSARRFIKGLGNLTELRVLRVMIKEDDEKQLRYLLESLSNLRKIEVIHVDFYDVQLKRGVRFEPADFLSTNLRFLELPWFEFSRLPSSIRAEHLWQLCHLSLTLFDVDEQDLEILGKFPELRYLHLLILNTENREAINCPSGTFPKMRFCSITKPLKFLMGAMPRLEVLDFHFNVRLQSGADSDLDFDLGLENICSLQQVTVQINCLHAFPEEVEQAEASLRDIIHTHPNRPILDIILSHPKLEKADINRANDISNRDKGKGVEMAEGHSKLSYYSKSLSSVQDGIDKPIMDEIIKRLYVVDNEAYNKKMKIVPIVRSEGLGKTTLAQKVFDKISPHFDSAAFVLVGQNPDMRKVLTDILIGLDKQKYKDSPMTILDIMHLIGLVRKSLINKRFFVVIDDIWDLKAWDIIKCALIENSNGSAVLTTISRQNWEHQKWRISVDGKLDSDVDKQSDPRSTTEHSLQSDAGTPADMPALSLRKKPRVELSHEPDSPAFGIPQVEETQPEPSAFGIPEVGETKPVPSAFGILQVGGTQPEPSAFGIQQVGDTKPVPSAFGIPQVVGTQPDPNEFGIPQVGETQPEPSASGIPQVGGTDPEPSAFGIPQLLATQPEPNGTEPEPSLFLKVDRKEFYEVLFGSEDKCPNDLKDICKDLIEMCDGDPAVVHHTVGLLEHLPKTVKDWQPVYQTIKFDLSYPKLPGHLKDCLRYFSMFPKGYEISAERLVWAWIAQGFINEIQGQQDLQKQEVGKSYICYLINRRMNEAVEGQQDLEKQEVGKSYLSDLINRKMIEAVEVDADGMALSCRAHDLLYGSIVSKSKKEKFVEILNGLEGKDYSQLDSEVIRLSVQIRRNNAVQFPAEGLLKKVQSLVVSCDTVPSLSDFQGVHAMDLGGCDSLQVGHLKGISKTSLTYLVIGGKYIRAIPREVSRLQNLRTLDFSASGLSELPRCVLSLTDLKRLFVNSHMKIPGNIARMTGLQELGDINIVKPELLQRLKKLSKLRVLRIALWSWDEGKSSVKVWWEALHSLLVSCKNIKSLCILTFCSLDFMDDSGDKWPPQALQSLAIRHSAFHHKQLPSWFDSLANLSSLTIEVNKLSENIFSTLGKLSALCSLSLTSKEVPTVYFVIDSHTFKKLESLKFVCNAMVVEMFAEPKSNASQQLIKRLTIVFQASCTKEINNDFRFGLDNLRSLEQVRVEINCFNASHQMVNDAEDAIREELSRAGSGSSQPNLEIRRLDEESMIEEQVQTSGHQVAMTSSLKTEGNGDKSDLMDVVESTTLQAEPVAVGQVPMSSAVVVVASSMKKEHATKKRDSTVPHPEVEELKKKSEVTEQALANTQREFEEFKKQMKTEGNGDKSDSMDVVESTTLQAEPVVVGQVPMSNADVVVASYMKIEKSTDRALWLEHATKNQDSTVLHPEVEELKKKSEVIEQALANTQREFEEFKKQMKTEGNGDKSDSMDVVESTTLQAEPVVVGQVPMSSAEVVLASSMKIEKSTDRTLWQEHATKKQDSTVLHPEVEELKKKCEVTEHALANTQREFEEFKKQMEENNLLLKRILQLNNVGIS